MNCEIIIAADMYRHGMEMLLAMIKHAPIKVVERDRYYGDCDLMMTYGIGHDVRRPWFRAHIASGRHAIAWDLGYFRGDKDSDDRAMRVTIDHDHPQAWLDDRPADRFLQHDIRLRNDYDPNGHIVLVGMGVKTNKMLHFSQVAWETGALKRIRKVYPVAKVIYRPKREDGTSLPGTKKMVGTPIEEVLAGASLVVCRHSNVAVDACIAGIPVVCEDGAASILYGKDLLSPVKPTPQQRLRFLQNLAWWQWKPSEAKECWQFLLQRIEEKDCVST